MINFYFVKNIFCLSLLNYYFFLIEFFINFFVKFVQCIIFNFYCFCLNFYIIFVLLFHEFNFNIDFYNYFFDYLRNLY